jgi:hypothetical protein
MAGREAVPVEPIERLVLDREQAKAGDGGVGVDIHPVDAIQRPFHQLPLRRSRLPLEPLIQKPTKKSWTSSPVSGTTCRQKAISSLAASPEMP